MATSLQRIIVLTLMLDLLLVLTGIYYAGTNNYQNELNTYTNNIENYNSNYSSTYGSATPETEMTVLDKTFGDQKYGGSMWWSLFKAGITVPKTCQGINEVNCPQMEQYMMKGYSYAIIIINALLLFEAFLVFYTKKNS